MQRTLEGVPCIARARSAVAAGGRLVRSAPLALSFAALLLATTIALRHFVANDDAVLRWASSNIDNLATQPIRALVVSAAFLPDQLWLPVAAAIGVVLVPLERRFGGLRTLLVVASGHVLATLATEGGVAVGLALGVLPGRDASRLDVGISYGLWAAASAALVLLPRRRRIALAAVGALAVLAPLALDPGMTTAGHALSFAIGLGWWPVLLRARRPESPDAGHIVPL